MKHLVTVFTHDQRKPVENKHHGMSTDKSRDTTDSKSDGSTLQGKAAQRYQASYTASTSRMCFGAIFEVLSYTHQSKRKSLADHSSKGMTAPRSMSPWPLRHPRDA